VIEWLSVSLFRYTRNGPLTELVTMSRSPSLSRSMYVYADPAFAAQAGFEAPIIHGMCSYGVTCKAVVDEVLKGDVTCVARYSARFSGIFFPGETFEIAYWNEGDKILIESSSKERQTPVISNAAITLC
jgi:hypothetical protein